ncbi:MAG: RIP metalloprotease RseP [Bacilli bacterium]|nr:RIP metalloprotease RseP [Bacilli bacterium]
MSIIINILLFIVILGSIVFVHEFGHFIFAKICGVYVYEFALGMGPKLFSKKGKETEYTIRAIPIGGFCQMAGEDLESDKEKKIPKKKQLQSKTAFQRFLIMFFGPANNFIFAIIILFFIALIWGGTTMKPVVSKLEKNYPAIKAGIEKKDTITKVNNHKVSTSDDMALYLAIAKPNKKTKIEVKKENGSLKTYEMKPKKVKIKGEDSYKFGISIENKKTYGFINAIVYTFNKTKSIFKQMTITLGYLFTGGIKLNQLSGPVGIYTVVGSSSKTGLVNILYLVAFLSINVGFINLIPLPAFDGGHILFIIIEKIKGSPVKPETENMIHTIGLFLLMLLMIFITFNDILKLF